MPYKDPEQQKAAQRRHYLANKAKYIETASASKLVRRRVLCKYVQEVKKQRCADCKLQYPYYVMEFDHVRGKKEGNVASLVREVVSMARLQAEIAKCEVVCANCHRERTWQRKGCLPLT